MRFLPIKSAPEEKKCSCGVRHPEGFTFGESKKDTVELRKKLKPLLKALRFVESSNRPENEIPDGDMGSSIGPFQVSEAYHQDAWRMPAPCLELYAKCRTYAHAEATVMSYWMKYCPDAMAAADFEKLAKTHNGGPNGMDRESTLYYWGKVNSYLQNPIKSWHELERERKLRRAVILAPVVFAATHQLLSIASGEKPPPWQR
eukprot:jgi/Mesvir1/2996/Mv06892-RA.1